MGAGTAATGVLDRPPRPIRRRGVRALLRQVGGGAARRACDPAFARNPQFNADVLPQSLRACAGRVSACCGARRRIAARRRRPRGRSGPTVPSAITPTTPDRDFPRGPARATPSTALTRRCAMMCAESVWWPLSPASSPTTCSRYACHAHRLGHRQLVSAVMTPGPATARWQRAIPAAAAVSGSTRPHSGRFRSMICRHCRPECWCAPEGPSKTPRGKRRSSDPTV